MLNYITDSEKFMANSNEYMKEYMLKRWKNRRAKAIEQLGGCCVRCNSTENLEFDHIDASEKSFSVSKFSSASEQKWQEEIKKCQLLCSSCHVIKSRKSGDYGDRDRKTVCSCGKVFYTTRSYAGHKRWCNIGH